VRNSVSLVVLDLSMPGMPGVAVRAQLRKLCPDIPVVYFSGYALQRSDDVDGRIEKPILPKELLRSVRQVLDRAAERKTSE
jgi:CheY-like chemotaxis protein